MQPSVLCDPFCCFVWKPIYINVIKKKDHTNNNIK